jgi:hypothetical protein
MCEADQRMGALGRGQAFEVCGSELGDELVRVDARSRDRPYIFIRKPRLISEVACASQRANTRHREDWLVHMQGDAIKRSKPAVRAG